MKFIIRTIFAAALSFFVKDVLEREKQKDMNDYMPPKSKKRA